MNLLLTTLLSTILFNVSFFSLDYCGWLILFFPIPIYFVCSNCNARAMKIWGLGLLWGIVSFGGHFVWLLILLLTKSNATVFIAGLLYLIVIIYLSITSGFWFLISNFIIKKIGLKTLSNRWKVVLSVLVLAVSGWLYFLFLQDYAGRLLGKNMKYPFISPAIPLAGYKWFFKLFCLIFSLPYLTEVNINNEFGKVGELCEILYLKPDENQSHRNSPAVAAQRIYQKLAVLNLLERAKQDKALIIASPETTFPFALNKYPEAIEMWTLLLPPQAYLLIGALRQKGKKTFQTIYLISQGRITGLYDKKQPIVFTEHVPSLFKNKDFFTTLFLLGKNKINSGKSRLSFDITEKLRLVPLICSDFFWASKNSVPAPGLCDKKLNLVFALVNDSWFHPYFRKIMQNYACLKAVQLGVPTFYVTHSKMKFIKPVFVDTAEKDF